LMKRQRTCTPSAGHYNPNFNLVDNPSKCFKFFYKPPQSVKKREVSMPPCVAYHDCSFENRKTVRLKSPTHTQTSRPQTSQGSFLLEVSKNEDELMAASSPKKSPLAKNSNYFSPHKSKTAYHTDLAQYVSMINPFIFSPEVPRGHLKSAILFEKQKSREEFVDPTKGPNEKRFDLDESQLNPTILTSVRVISPPIFSKTTGRRKNILINKKELFFPDYNPSKEATQKSLSVGVPNFNRYVKRPSPEIKKGFFVPECYPTEILERSYTSQSHIRKTKETNMDKMLPRDDKMYYISDGFNLKEKNFHMNSSSSFIDMSPDRTPLLRKKSSNLSYSPLHSRAASAKPLLISNFDLKVHRMGDNFADKISEFV